LFRNIVTFDEDAHHCKNHIDCF